MLPQRRWFFAGDPNIAVLADKAKPVWTEAHSPEVSRICDSEMARINIEASAALAE